jgi:hypothetical protein
LLLLLLLPSTSLNQHPEHLHSKHHRLAQTSAGVASPLPIDTIAHATTTPNLLIV